MSPARGLQGGIQAELRPGHRVLDIGCGTGSLVVLTKQLFPDVDVVGLDPDENALTRATRKAHRVGASIHFDRGFADALPYPAGSFDRVLSSFMFHHLQRDEKARTLREIRRVLKADGTLHLLDFGRPGRSGHRPRLPVLRAHHRLIDNDERTILGLLTDAGLEKATKISERTMLRYLRVAYYRAGGG